MSNANEQTARDVVERFYRQVIPADASLVIVTGGLSNASVWRVDSGEQSWALRCWGAAGPGIDRVRWIHSVLQFAERNGIDFLPIPVRADHGQLACEREGVVWELAPWLPGRAAAPGPSSGALLLATAALVKFHAAVLSFALPPDMRRGQPSPAIFDRREKLAAALRVDWPVVATQAARCSPNASLGAGLGASLHAIASQLSTAIPQALRAVDEVHNQPQQLQVIIRDPRRDHFLFSRDRKSGGDRVTGLVDFGAMTVDSPAVDWARLLGDWAADDSASWLAALEKSPLSPAARRLLGPLDASGVVLSCCNWLRWIAAGHPPPGERLTRLRRRLESLGGLSSPAHHLA